MYVHSIKFVSLYHKKWLLMPQSCGNPTPKAKNKPSVANSTKLQAMFYNYNKAICEKTRTR